MPIMHSPTAFRILYLPAGLKHKLRVSTQEGHHLFRFRLPAGLVRATLSRVSTTLLPVPYTPLLGSRLGTLIGSALSRLAWAHAHETLIWASKGRGARHTFNYDLINSPNPGAQLSSVWRIRSVPKNEKLHGYHPTQKPLRLVRRALLASSREGDLIFDPFCGSGTTAVAAKELGRFFVGAELEEEFCELAARRIGAAVRGSLSREISSSSGGARGFQAHRWDRRPEYDRSGQDEKEDSNGRYAHKHRLPLSGRPAPSDRPGCLPV